MRKSKICTTTQPLKTSTSTNPWAVANHRYGQFCLKIQSHHFQTTASLLVHTGNIIRAANSLTASGSTLSKTLEGADGLDCGRVRLQSLIDCGPNSISQRRYRREKRNIYH